MDLERPYQLARRHFRPRGNAGPLLLDSFTRPNGAPGSAETGQVYTVSGCSIVSNALKCTGGNARITADIGIADRYYVEGQLSFYGHYPEVFIRYVDASNFLAWQFDSNAGYVRLHWVAAGVLTQLADISLGGSFTGALANTAICRAEVVGTELRVKTAGILRGQFSTDKFLAAVRVGVGCRWGPDGCAWTSWKVNRL